MNAGYEMSGMKLHTSTSTHCWFSFTLPS